MILSRCSCEVMIQLGGRSTRTSVLCHCWGLWCTALSTALDCTWVWFHYKKQTPPTWSQTYKWHCFSVYNDVVFRMLPCKWVWLSWEASEWRGSSPHLFSSTSLLLLTLPCVSLILSLPPLFSSSPPLLYSSCSPPGLASDTHLDGCALNPLSVPTSTLCCNQWEGAMLGK